MSVPPTPGLSAYRTSVVHRALARPQVTANHHRFGSMVSIAPDDIAAVRVPVATPGFGPPLPPPPLLLLLLDPQAAASSAATAASAASGFVGRCARSGIRFLAITFSDHSLLLFVGRIDSSFPSPFI